MSCKREEGGQRRAGWLSIWVACSLQIGAAHVIPRLASHLINCPRHPTKSDLLCYLGTKVLLVGHPLQIER